MFPSLSSVPLIALCIAPATSWDCTALRRLPTTPILLWDSIHSFLFLINIRFPNVQVHALESTPPVVCDACWGTVLCHPLGTSHSSSFPVSEDILLCVYDTPQLTSSQINTFRNARSYNLYARHKFSPPVEEAGRAKQVKKAPPSHRASRHWTLPRKTLFPRWNECSGYRNRHRKKEEINERRYTSLRRRPRVFEKRHAAEFFPAASLVSRNMCAAQAKNAKEKGSVQRKDKGPRGNKVND